MCIFRTPFDTETYYGFIICVFIQSFGSVTWTMAFVAPLLLYMGLCSYVMAHAKDFKTIMTKLDDQLLLNSYTAKKKPINMIDMHSTLIGILKEAHETHLDLFKYDTELNLFYLNCLNEFSLLSTDCWKIHANPCRVIYTFSFCLRSIILRTLFSDWTMSPMSWTLTI